MSDPVLEPVVFPGDLTIHCAAERAAELVGLLAPRLETEAVAGQALALDLSAVADIDSAGVQLLLSARQLCTRHGRTLQVCSASATLQAALDAFGLDDHLQSRHPAAHAPA